MVSMTREVDEPILVEEMAAGHYPRRFTWREHSFEVVEAGGMWRLRGRWWEGEGEREFVRVVTTSEICFDLCWQESTASWQVHKVYD